MSTTKFLSTGIPLLIISKII